MKKSIIWKIDKNERQILVNNSGSRSEVLRKLNLSTNGASNHNRLKLRFEQDNIDTSSLNGIPTDKSRYTWKKNLDDILVENSDYLNRVSLKKRLLSEHLLIDICNSCGITHWLNSKLSLQLHHKNGIFNDNRLENLELLCPNCHSITDNYSGKNNTKP